MHFCTNLRENPIKSNSFSLYTQDGDWTAKGEPGNTTDLIKISKLRIFSLPEEQLL
jgi:hypothetical protein